ncbi:hypothetical protein BVRB_2g030540 [Beta vulgaris subsp. vulgaris]|nr:hypothetical protein BVRB_2g030540 [Beta vulgaris subsp. vulgaris]
MMANLYVLAKGSVEFEVTTSVCYLWCLGHAPGSSGYFLEYFWHSEMLVF